MKPECKAEKSWFHWRPDFKKFNGFTKWSRNQMTKAKRRFWRHKLKKMAKVTITFEDAPNNKESGEVNINFEFDPAIDDSHGTPAQHAAVDVMNFINQRTNES